MSGWRQAPTERPTTARTTRPARPARPTRWSSRSRDRALRRHGCGSSRRDGEEQVCEFDGSSLTIGRAADNDLVLADGRVSRHHARIAGRRGTLVYTDLGSTNGSRVNGATVGELVLGAGDRIELGDTTLMVEATGDGT